MILNAVGEGLDAAVKEEPLLPVKEPKTPVEVMERKFAEKKAVLTKLERDSKALEAEREQIDAEIAERIAEQRPTAALDAASSRLTQKIMANDLLAAEVQTTPTLMSEALGDKLAGEGVEGIMSAQEIVAAERNTEERIAAAKRSFFTHGAAYAKREVQRVQKYLEELVKRSGMDKADRAKFIAAIRNTQTIEQLEVNYPEIRDRIFVAEEVRRARASEQILAAALKAGKVKSVDGKATGKFGDADTQAVVTAVNAVNKMTRSRAELEMVAAEERLRKAEDVREEGYTPAAHALAYYTYQAARFRAGEMSTEQGAEFVSDLTAMMAGARARFLATQEAAREEILADEQFGTTETMGDIEFPPAWDKSRVESGSWVKGFTIPRGLVGLYERGFANLGAIAHLLGYRSGKEAGKSWVEKFFNANKEETRFEGLKRKYNEKFNAAAESSYGIKGTPRQKDRVLRQIRKEILTPHDLGTHNNAVRSAKYPKGEPVKMEYSRDEAMKFYMELQDPTLTQNITHPEALAYTPEMINEVLKLLTDADKRFAQEQLQIYRDLYTEVNAVYRKMRGVDLPFNAVYSPVKVIRTRSAAKDAKGMDLDNPADQVRSTSTMGSWALPRIRHLNPLAKQSAMAAFNDHVYALTRYIAYEAKVQRWNSLLANPRFRAAVVGIYGDEVFLALEDSVKLITKGSHERALMRGMDKMLTNLIVGSITFKPNAIPKQLTAVVLFANAVPAKHLPLFLKELAALPVKGLPKEWVNCDFVTTRNLNQSQDLKAAREYARSAVAGTPARVAEAGAAFIKFGDRAGIVAGGGALFRYLRSKGMSVEEALDVASETARQTQSSGSLIDLSALQAKTGFYRLFTAFMNQPVQMLRMEMQTFTDMASKGFIKGEGRISRLDAIKTLLLVHFLAPMLFQLVIDMGWDDENQRRAMYLGPFNSVPVYAEIISKLFHIIMEEEGREMPFNDLLESLTRDIGRGVEALKDADDPEAFIAALTLLSDPIFKAVWGIPTKPIANTYEGMKIIMGAEDGELLDAMKLVAGWSPYAIAEQNRR
jgi:hypothetical protein